MLAHVLMPIILASPLSLLVAGSKINTTLHGQHKRGPIDDELQAADEAVAMAERMTHEDLKLVQGKQMVGEAATAETNTSLRPAHRAAAQANSPAPSQEQAAVDAANAHTAADNAGEAAKVATQVAKHSVHLAKNAKSALKRAKDALHKARVGTKGLTVDQKHSLQNAESKLEEATKSTEYGTVKDARDAKQYKELQYQLERNAAPAPAFGMSEVQQLRSELKELQEELKGKKGGEEEKESLAKLEELVTKIEEDAAAGKPTANIDEVKVEIDKLRDAINRLEAADGLVVARHLVHELPPATNPGDIEIPSTPSSVEPMKKAETIVPDKSIDIDTSMPYGDLEPFGREDTAQELTESSIRESDSMVDQLERAEVAEEKRAVFRALTRLRGAAITSFDGVARSQTGNIDQYNKVHKWRNSHPLHHLADEEADIAKWAFPDNADF